MTVYQRVQWIVFFVVLMATPRSAWSQSGFDDDRVMLQGFYWESYRHGDAKFPQYGNKKWYQIAKENAGAIREGRFDLIWLPPPSFAGGRSAGYNPKQYWKFDNSYGSLDQHRAMLEELLKNGIEPVADIVINHRDGETSWADFKNPDWGLKTICRSDEIFSSKDSPFKDTPEDQRGAEEERPKEYTQHGGTCYQYPSFRDLDHTNPDVRRDIFRYLLSLKSLGYRGWRYDMVHGYHARRVMQYNQRTQPTFSVGEYDWSAHGEMRGWVWNTATTKDDLKTSSNVFDFTTMFTLKGNKGNYKAWYGYGNGLGIMGDNTDKQPWKQRAVTFLENHDTGYRTNEDGTPQQDHKSDSFANNWEVEQAYAYILTHPGVPCVYWKHYFDWGNDLREKIKALINARKVAGVHSGSTLFTQNNAGYKNVYAARITGSKGDIYVRIGGADNDWQPSDSSYKDYREYAQGAGWKVWVGLPNNPGFQQAPRRPAFDVPTYKAAESITIPDDWLALAPARTRAVRSVESLSNGVNPRKIRNSRKPLIADFLGKRAVVWNDLLNGVQEVGGSNPVAPTGREVQISQEVRNSPFFSMTRFRQEEVSTEDDRRSQQAIIAEVSPAAFLQDGGQKAKGDKACGEAKDHAHQARH